ncbi:MAG: YfiR family protein [Candidatus Riflebacteria bacterium]|nr:YfiR family protein [Candidatus Riflebacteria bacterium]
MSAEDLDFSQAGRGGGEDSVEMNTLQAGVAGRRLPPAVPFSSSTPGPALRSAGATRVTVCRATGSLRATLLTGALCVMVLLSGAVDSARATQDEEYRVQAAFIFNFVKFVTWPQDAFAGGRDKLTIGIFGENPFGDALASVNGAAIGGRTVVVREVKDLASAQSCQLLFISRSEQARLPAVLASLGSQPILTVSEIAGFARSGGIFEFVLVSDTIRFKVNLAASRQRGLDLSSQLLGVAIEVLKN